MKISLEKIADIIDTAIWADNVYEFTAEVIADAKIEEAVDKCVKGLIGFSKNQGNSVLKDVAEAVDDE